MTLTVLLFARLREHFQGSEIQLDLPEGSNAGDLIAALVEQCPAIAPFRSGLKVAVAQDIVGLDTKLVAGAEVAVFPPVGGG